VGDSIYYKPNTVDAFWADPVTFGPTVTAGTDPFVVTIPLHSAGAVYGIVTQANGKPIGNRLSVSLELVGRNEVITNVLAGFHRSYSVDDNGRYLLKPLVLNRTYRIAVRRDDRTVFSDPFTPTDAAPVMQVNIKLP
jgi:hypothetical protein